MKIRTARYIVKEGFINTYRNVLMSLASIMIVIATLIVFGFFMLIAVNLELNVNVIRDQPQIEVFCYTELDDTQVLQVEEAVKGNVNVASYEKITKSQAMKKMKDRFGDDKSILEGLEDDILPVSFKIKLKDPEISASVVEEFKNMTGVEKVSFSKEAIDLISKITYWMRFISAFMIIILFVISVFIISNTIKLTVFARRKEINIMKFIGGTDWFIRWPFVIEGIIIGLAGAVAAFVITGLGYNAFESKFNADFSNMDMAFFKLLKFNSIWVIMFMYYAIIGVVVGSVGSLLSLRRYLKV